MPHLAAEAVDANDNAVAEAAVSPIANVSAVGVTATSLTACATVIVAAPEAEPDVAVIVVSSPITPLGVPCQCGKCQIPVVGAKLVTT